MLGTLNQPIFPKKKVSLVPQSWYVDPKINMWATYWVESPNPTSILELLSNKSIFFLPKERIKNNEIMGQSAKSLS
jgi:hypothetical protein